MLLTFHAANSVTRLPKAAAWNSSQLADTTQPTLYTAVAGASTGHVVVINANVEGESGLLGSGNFVRLPRRSDADVDRVCPDQTAQPKRNRPGF